MNPRFDRRSNNSPRPNRPGGRRKQGKDYFSKRSSGREEPTNERGSYRSRSERREDNQDRREFTTNGGNRRARVGQERRYEKENNNEISRDRSFPRGPKNQRLVLRREEQRSGRRSNWARRSSSLNIPLGSPLPDGEVITSSQPKDASGQIIASDMIWGRHTTQSALESGRPVHRIWCTSDIRSSQRFLQLLRDAKSSGVLVEEVTWARLGQLTNGAVHQGIAIQIAAAETLDLSTLIDGCNSLGESPLLLALDGLTDPQNLGAIVRSAEAFGAHGLVLPQRRSAGLTGSVAKVAAGALEHLPVARVVNLNRSLEDLKKAGYRVVGLAEEGNVTLPELDLEGPLVVVTGSEGKGISLVTRRHCDQLVRIPLRGITPSLNAAAATAVFLYEVARNGWMKGLSGQAPSPRMVRAKCSSSLGEDNEESSFNQKKLENKVDDPQLEDQIESHPLVNDLMKNTREELDEGSEFSPFEQSVHL